MSARFQVQSEKCKVKSATAQKNHWILDIPCPSKAGFTLIELMVTIVIIAILASVGFATYSSAQKSGRISKRIQDLQAIQTAVEAYHTATGYYPKAQGSGAGPYVGLCITSTSAGALSNASVNPPFVPTYMPSIPLDPSGNAGGSSPCYMYESDTNGTEYKIWTNVPSSEMGTADYAIQMNMIDPNRDGDGTVNCTVNPAGTFSAWALYSSLGTSTTIPNACGF